MSRRSGAREEESPLRRDWLEDSHTAFLKNFSEEGLVALQTPGGVERPILGLMREGSPVGRQWGDCIQPVSKQKVISDPKSWFRVSKT